MGDKKGGKGKKGKGGGGKIIRFFLGLVFEAKENVVVSINFVCLGDFFCEIYVCFFNYCIIFIIFGLVYVMVTFIGV